MITAKQITPTEIPLRYAAGKLRLPDGVSRAALSEIRLRAGKRAFAVTCRGELIPLAAVFSREDIEACFIELCRNSVHSFEREIAEGYITLPGGHRAGFCGTAVYKNGVLSGLKDISSINLRLAREHKGCADALYKAAFGDGLCSLMVCGRPLSGKTTILRDLSRILGAAHKVALIDSRNEMAAVYKGVPALDVGENTDVLSGVTKADGITRALRSLSPEVIICDEIGDDAREVTQCLRCGVKIIASAHAESLEELYERPAVRDMLPCFKKAALIGDHGRLITIESIKER